MARKDSMVIERMLAQTSDKTVDSSRSLNLTNAFIALLPLALIAVAFWPSFGWIAKEWNLVNGPYSHGFLSVAMAAYLFWANRLEIVRPASNFALPSFLVLTASTSVWIVANALHIGVLESLAISGALIGVYFTVFCLSSWRWLMPPLVLLIFVLPMWDWMNYPLQAIATWVVANLFALFDVPLLSQGLSIELPNGSFVVEGGCSGLRFLMAALALAFFNIGWLQLTLRSSLLLICLSLIASLVGNWIRIAIVVGAGYATDMQSSLLDDHVWLGWITFAAVVAPVFFLINFKKFEAPSSRAAVDFTFSKIAVTAFLILLAVGALGVLKYSSHNAKQVVVLSGDVDYSEVSSFASGWAPQFEGAQQIQRLEIQATPTVELYIARFDTQSQGREVLYGNNTITHWQGRPVGLERLRDGEVLVTSGNQDYLVRYWYQTPSGALMNARELYLSYLKNFLKGGDSVTVIGLSARCEADCEAERLILDVMRNSFQINEK